MFEASDFGEARELLMPQDAIILCPSSFYS